MTGSRCLLAATVALASALAAAPLSAAPSRSEAPKPCPRKVQAAGARWALATSSGFSCARAATIVTTLAGKKAPRPAGRYPGTYAGLVCVGRLPGQKPGLLICGNPSGGRGFTAARGI